MSDHVMGCSKIKTKGCVPCYESAWLGRWTRSNTDAKRLKEINLPGDGHLLKESTGPVTLKGKMVSEVLDLFPNPDSAVQSVEVKPDMNTIPPIVGDRNSAEWDEDETSRSTSQSKNVELFPNNYTNTKLLSECKRIWSDSETNTRSQVKRLKTCASDNSRNENKNMMVVKERPSGQKVDYFFHRLFGINNHGSRKYPKPSTSQIKNRNRRKREDVNPWIQRWCKKKAAETNELGGKQDVHSKGTVLEETVSKSYSNGIDGEGSATFTPKWSLKKKTPSSFGMFKI